MQDAVQVDADWRLPCFGIHLNERPRLHTFGAGVAGVVYENVDGPSWGKGREDRVQVGDIEENGTCRATRQRDLVNDLVSSLLDNVVDQHLCSLSGQGVSDSGTNVLAGSRHEGDSFGKVVHRLGHGAGLGERSLKGLSLSGAGSRGRPRTRSARMFR